jgi:hypothetical protein
LEAEAQAAQARATTNLDAYNQMANQMGLPRGGGWAASVARTGNEFAPGFVDIEDPIRAVEDLARAGALSPARAQELVQDRTARPTEAEMRLITDYVVSAASQMNRGAWNAPQGTQGTGTAQNASQGLPSPPVAAVGNPEAYSEKMASVSALNEAIRSQQMTPEQRAQAEAVINAKSRQDKEAALGQGTGNPAVDSLLRSAVNMTSARSRDPGSPRARAQAPIDQMGAGDPTARRTQRGGLRVDPFSGSQQTPGQSRNARATGAPQPSPALMQPTAATEPLEGLPTKIASIPYPVGPDPDLRGVAEQYMADAGMPYNPARKYVRIMDKQGNSVDGRKENSEAIAKAFDALPVDNMSDPLVRASYEAVARETLAQYEALKKLGVKIEFNPEPNKDPYNGPWGAFRDFRENRHLYVFPTNDTRDPSGASYGSSGALANEDPMLRVVEGEDWGHGIPVTVNDIFRAVHDIFGHFKEGVGFRWDGDENAWRAHAAMYSPLARLAMTTETRGQNSWLNFGPHGESNRTAKTEDTVFADQKKAILPAWAHYTGAEDFLNPVNIEQLRVENNAQLPEPPKRSGRQVKGPRTQLDLPGVLTEGSPSVKDTTSVPEILNGTFSGFLIGEKFIRKSKGGKVTLPGVGEYFDSRTPRILKPTAEDMDRVINATTEEAVFQLGNARSGKGWFSESTREAIDIASARIPELKDNPALQTILFAVASYLSGGNTPREEGRRAFQALEDFMDTGLFSVTPTTVGRNYTPKEAQLLNHLIRKFGGVEGAAEWLMSPHSQREIYDTRVGSGAYGSQVPKHLRLTSNEPMLGMFVLGEKFGPYALNKAGFEEYATKDMWAYRNFFRKLGTLTGPVVAQKTGLRDGPSAGEASMLDEVFQDVSRRIGASVADTQAILWFLEQRLYRELGVPGINSYTLADGAREYLRKSE